MSVNQDEYEGQSVLILGGGWYTCKLYEENQ